MNLELLKSKLKSKALIGALLSLIITQLMEFGVINISNNQIDQLVNILLAIMIGFGVFTNSKSN